MTYYYLENIFSKLAINLHKAKLGLLHNLWPSQLSFFFVIQCFYTSFLVKVKIFMA